MQHLLYFMIQFSMYYPKCIYEILLHLLPLLLLNPVVGGRSIRMCSCALRYILIQSFISTNLNLLYIKKGRPVITKSELHKCIVKSTQQLDR